MNRFFALAFSCTALLTAWTIPAHALTNQDIAGVYQGTSTLTTASGQQVTAAETLTIKASGKLKGTATVNGQTVSSKGKYQFVSEFALTETANGGEAVGFTDLEGNTLTFNLLVRLDNGEIVKEVTTLTLVKKL